ncbi:hypothetical protein QBC47DRAFT_342171 [Echria macrotheca]|uniref:Nephrocystin 3-like N-terminal domain-containing protein n=1 Tax=Echria macrotheca TaxID=438768 RepID=A0AAJ0BH76_9PEZI|nr:hypothetical protein QBC47DRAFT_342171 [Echria macrotheca]
MDPVSAVASIIAVVQCTDRIVQLCRYYIEAVDDYPKDLRSILIEASTLKALLENLRCLIDCDGSSSPMLKILGGEEGPLEGCRRAAAELESLFPASSETTAGASRRKRLKQVVGQLAWPFRQEKARVLLAQVQQHKATINLAISSEALHDVKESKNGFGAVCRMLNDSETSDVCTWVEQNNPSELHNRAVADYEAGTGDWITRTPEWKTWIDAKDSQRCLWIHGIPGAGKTVLASYAIRQIIRTIKEPNSGNSVCAYYYCYHARNQDESTPALRWIVSQLCRASNRVPEPLYEAYRLRRLPSTDDLLQHLETILEQFKRAFIVIDALDESQSREKLLHAIQKIQCDTRFTKIRLLVTSREYADIEREMLSIAATPLSMSNEFVKDDIRKFIAATLRSNSLFQKWPEAFRVEVEEALSSGAKGMFRWAVCQLDILRRLRYQNMVREAIKNLPQTLDETYERIFSLIADEDVDLVRHCLWWTMFHNVLWDSDLPLMSNILIDTYYLMTGKEVVDDQPLVTDVEILREACGCLLSFSLSKYGGHKVNLSHYTVREYLESGRSHTGRSALFSRDGNSPYDEEVTALFTHSTELEAVVDLGELTARIEDTDERNAIASEIAVYQLASCVRVICVDKIKARPSLVYDFLDLRRSHMCQLVDVLGQFREFCDEFLGELECLDFRGSDGSTREAVSDDFTKVVVMAYLLWLGRVDLASEFLKLTGSSALAWHTQLRGQIFSTIWCRHTGMADFKTFSGNIFEVVAIMPCLAVEAPDALGFLLDHRPTYAFDPTSVLVHYIGRHRHNRDETCDEDCPLRILLGMGADPNAQGFPCTPLQIAVVGRDLHGAQKLLEAGADPNETGSNEAESWEEGTALDAFSGLRGVKPVDILSTFDHRAFTPLHDEKDMVDEIFQLLNSIPEVRIAS